MPILPIPINYGLDNDIAELGYTNSGPAAVDLYATSNGNLERRPALVEFADLSVSYGVNGLFWWDRQEKVIAVSNGRIFPITDVNGTVGTEISGNKLSATGPVYWADFGTSLYAADGGRIVKIPSSGSSAYVSDADAPTSVTHITVLDDYLLALADGTQLVHYSAASNPDSWAGAWITALAKPDLVRFVGAQNDIIELYGTEILEGWRNDGSTPFVKEAQYTVNRGLAAAYSPQYIEDHWYFLDKERQVLRLNGRTPEIISLSLNRYIKTFSKSDDAIGGQTSFNGRPQYILFFPTAKRTISLDIHTGVWTELGKWSSTDGSYSQFLGRSFCFAAKWNLYLVGDHKTGKIYKLDKDSFQDGGATLRSMIRTPNIHWDQPGLWKRSSRLDFYLRMENPGSANLVVRWRDNGSKAWKAERTVSLQRTAANEYHGYLNRMGKYKSRQYEVYVSDSAAMYLSRIMETFRIVGGRE